MTTTYTVSQTEPKSFPKKIDFPDYLNKHPIVKKNKAIVRQFTSPQNPVEPKFGNGFVGAAFSAYSHHHYLKLRPDDIQLAIILALADYIDFHAEEMRALFVDHDGKEKLQIDTNHPIDWPAIIEQFSTMIDAKTKDDVKEFAVPQFSTTTEKDRLVGCLALMGAMKNYFSYEVFIECGLPGITFEGTLDDWQKVRKLADKILFYAQKSTGQIQTDLSNWHQMLVPVLDQFVTAYSGQIDNEFWNSICNYIPGGSGPSYISGWINVFIPFYKGKYVLRPEKRFKYGRIETGHVPTLAVEVPVYLNDNGLEIDLLFYTGPIVATYEQETNTISPAYDWVLLELPRK